MQVKHNFVCVKRFTVQRQLRNSFNLTRLCKCYQQGLYESGTATLAVRKVTDSKTAELRGNTVSIGDILKDVSG